MPSVFHYECDVCGATQPVPGNRPGNAVRPVYLLDGGSAYVPLLTTAQWCTPCAAIHSFERIPSDQEITRYLADARNFLTRNSLTAENFERSLLEFFAVVTSHEVAWRELARTRRGGFVRCLTCGHQITNSDERIEHAGCGGEFKTVDSDLHILPKKADSIEIELFEPNGLRPGRNPPHASEEPVQQKDPRSPGTSTSLELNAFWSLRVSTRDSKKRILEAFEERALELNPSVGEQARAELTNPRTRLIAELSWLPGLSPKRAEAVLEQLGKAPLSLLREKGLPAMAAANLLAAVLESGHASRDPKELAALIVALAKRADDVSVEALVREINEDRAVSGFPAVRAGEQMEADIADRFRSLRNSIKGAMGELAAEQLVAVMSLVAIESTDGGEKGAPRLVDDLVDSYEVESQGFLQREEENILKLVKAAEELASKGEATIGPVIAKLETVTRNWNRIAYPIKLVAKARGTSHQRSRDVANAIRGLSVQLFNKFDLLDQSKRLVSLLDELFSDVPEVAERTQDDAAALRDISAQRERAAQEREEWNRKITYSAEVGILFKDRLSISSDGLEWKGRLYPLETVTRVRWGAVRHSVNGIPSGTTYTIAFGDSSSEAIVELRRENVFSEFVSRLWNAVGVRLLTELLQMLQGGQELRFSGLLLRDDGVTLVKHKFLVMNESAFCRWGDVHVWSADGSFYVGAKNDKKTYSSLSYIHDPNTHVLEQAIRLAFKKPGLTRLSDLLGSG
jgi:hypothetical protein